MIVYADRSETVDTRQALLAAQRSTDGIEKLIRYGQVESAILDAAMPEWDDWNPLVELLRQGRIPALLTKDLPQTIEIRKPEGFAFYGVDPGQYARAAERFERECRPSDCVVIGIRSIGTALSRIVVESLTAPSWSCTVRPRGHPFSRFVAIGPILAEELLRRRDAWFLVVDEGPGISGSSMASVVSALSSLGIPEDRIVLFPANMPQAERFASDEVKRIWSRSRIVVEEWEKPSSIPIDAADLSFGAWRKAGHCPDIVPALEQRKYRSGAVLYKFAGLGHLGEAKLERSRALAGWVPRTLGLRDGFLKTQWMPSRAPTIADPLFAPAVAGYLRAIEERFTLPQTTGYERLCEMIAVNTGQQMPSRCPPVEDRQICRLDGRMFLHEWLVTADRFRKADALDHHDDHFFPGCQPIDWDYAASEIEMGVRLRPLAVFWRIAYLAWRIGFTNMFGQPVLETRYRAALDDLAAAGLPVTSEM